MLIRESRLTDFATAIFVSAGAGEEFARETAEHLVLANLKGHDSHGVGMIPTYIDAIHAGALLPNAGIETLRDQGAVLLLDGRFGFGQVVGRQATDLAIERVRNTGVVTVALRNAHHLGRIGTYAERCAAAGYVSVHFVNVVGHDPVVSPWAGREARMLTNPFCCAVPRDGERPIVLDMATSAVALGKVRVAWMKGEPVVGDVLLDQDGRPTENPGRLYEEPLGSIRPFGQHKGYGLGFICELLGGGLAGEWTIQPDNARTHHAREPHADVRPRPGRLRRPRGLPGGDPGHGGLSARHAARRGPRPRAAAGRPPRPNPGSDARRKESPSTTTAGNGIVDAARRRRPQRGGNPGAGSR